ncbi:MAG: hypothetical protein KAV87_63120 [Desulfobacteraceae bacterium]|nr:hypothetical protein [Desulfobacteraceae bacterium]
MMIKRLFRQRTSVMLSIPKPILAAMDLAAGDYVEIDVDSSDKQIRMIKVEGRIDNDRKIEVGKSERDNGGRT